MIADGTHEIIVVDNDSRDGTQDYLRRQGDIRTVLNGATTAFPKAATRAPRSPRANYIIFLNPDTWVTQGWAETMARYFEDLGSARWGPYPITWPDCNAST